MKRTLRHSGNAITQPDMGTTMSLRFRLPEKLTLAAIDGSVMLLGSLAEIVNRNVIDPLDHKNLNEDIEHFAKVNPSVENICAAVFGWLKDDIASAGCRLTEVKVFETPKTWASFRG